MNGRRKGRVRLIWTTRANGGDFVDAVVDRVAALSERGDYKWRNLL
jgi:hypothetical protein